MSLREMRTLVSGLAIIAAASVTGVASSTAASAEDAAAPVAVTISTAHVVTLPATIQPGVNEFAITTSAKTSDFQLAQLDSGYTVADAVSDIENGLEKGKIGPFKRFERNVTLFGGISLDAGESGTVTLDLEPGSYYAVDTRVNRARTFTAFTVAGADTGGTMPAGDSIRAVVDAKWAKGPSSIARKGVLTFKNRSSNNHFVGISKLKKGKTIEDFDAWIQAIMNGEGGPPPVRFDVTFDSGVVSPGQTVAMSYKLPKGKYVLVCFWPDASMGGMPHAFMGMYRGITLK